MMKKKLSRVISLLIATAMLLALAVPAFALGGEPLALATYSFIKTDKTAITTLSIDAKNSNNSKVQLGKLASDNTTYAPQIGLTLGEGGNITMSANPTVSLELEAEQGENAQTDRTLVITPVKNGITTITYTDADKSTATLAVTVTGIAATTYGFIVPNTQNAISALPITKTEVVQLALFEDGAFIDAQEGLMKLGDGGNITMSADPTVSLKLQNENGEGESGKPTDRTLVITPIKKGTTTITYTNGNDTATLAVTVSEIAEPGNIERTIDQEYMDIVTSRNSVANTDLPIELSQGVTITETADSQAKVKIVKLASREWQGNFYLAIPIYKPTSDETITLSLTDGKKLIIKVTGNLNDYFLPLEQVGDEYSTSLGGFHEFGDPKDIILELLSNMTNPKYEMSAATGKGKTLDFELNKATKTITASPNVDRDGYTKLFGTFLLYTQADKSDMKQFITTCDFAGQGVDGNPYHKDNDTTQVYWSENVYDQDNNKVLFTVGKMPSEYNAFWYDGIDPNQIHNEDVKSVKFEIPAAYEADGHELKGKLSLSDNGEPKPATHKLYGKDFKGVYGVTVSGIPADYKKPIYLKQTITYKDGTTSTPPAAYGSFSTSCVYYVLLEGRETNPDNHTIDLGAEGETRSIQQAIFDGGENVTVILKAKTIYRENIVVPYYVRIQGSEGSVIQAEKGSTAPVIRSKSLMRPVELFDLTIDGNETSVGVESEGGYFVVLGELNKMTNGCTVQNCTTGVRVPMDGGIVKSTIENNDIGIEFIQEMGYGVITENTITNNKVGVKFTKGYEFKLPYGSFLAQKNIVKLNTDANIKAEDGDKNAEFRNNFIELDAQGIPTKIVGTPLIHPYFMTADMGKVTADVTKLETTNDGKLEIPYIARVANANGAPIVDKKVFEDISGIPAAKGRASGKQTEPKPVIVQGYAGNKPAYSFSIAEITKPMDFNTRFDEEVAKPEIIDRTNYKDSKYRIVSFKHDGELPGKTEVTLRDDSGKYMGMDGQKLKLYLLNDTTGKLELVGNDAVTVNVKDGTVYLTFIMDHCSDYLITDVDVTDKGTTPPPYSPPANSGGGSPSAPTDVVDSGAVNDAISEAKGGKASIDVSQKPIMSGESFAELAKSPDTVLELKGDGFSWSFAGKDIDPKKLAGISFNTQISKKSPNAAQLTKAAGNAQFESVYFGYHGALPGKATIKVQTDFRNRIVKVYYFNSESLNLEYSGEAVVDSYGIAAFSITHCSDYVLSETEIPNSIGNPVKNEKPTTVPKTGVADNNWLNIIILVGMFFAAAIVTVKKLHKSK